ncbi:MAG: SpoIVB peptidase [Clostridia bacterium]|nr:SpoIVB peptidase [Clostridia bacterium]
MDAAQRNGIIRTIFFAVILSFFLMFTIHAVLEIPTQHRIAVGQELRIPLNYPKELLDSIKVHINSQNANVIKYKGINTKNIAFNPNDSWPVAANPGTVKLQVKLFGLIPLKNMIVDVLPQYEVIPGGQSIGVILKSHGIIVVGYSSIKVSGESLVPAKSAGIRVGDVILSINGRKADSEEAVAEIVDSAGRERKNVVMRVKRGKHVMNLNVKPVYCSETGRYRIGLYVRDNAAGVGTLTFYEPKSNIFGALGHAVSSGNSDQEVAFKSGKIIEATVQGIHQGKRGQPGEKIGIFLNDGRVKGNIINNSKYGIFGKMTQFSDENSFYRKPIPVAFSGQIKEGPAKMLTVVQGDNVEAFDIKILKVMPNQHNSGRGLVIKVTDKKLINLTGGIIQGMSGSPIIQNGRLVGAVTHVFINDPTQGYGVMAEWMLLESGILDGEEISRKVGVEFPGYFSFFIDFSKNFCYFCL